MQIRQWNIYNACGISCPACQNVSDKRELIVPESNNIFAVFFNVCFIGLFLLKMATNVHDVNYLFVEFRVTETIF